MSFSLIHDYIERGYSKRKLFDKCACFLIRLSALVALIPLFLVFGFVLIKGFPAFDFSFFVEIPKPVGETGGGMANAIIGSAILVLFGSTVGIIWGLSIGVYLSEFGSGKLATIFRFTTDILASVPSIIIGLFVYAVVVMPMKQFSALAGGLALGIIMIPIVARSAEELLRLVPNHIREAGLALGIARWKVIVFIVLRGAMGGILTGIILAVARIAGETAPLLFTALNNQFWQTSLIQPIASLPVQIYSYAISPFEDWHRQAWAGAMVLILIVFLINCVTRTVLKRKPMQ